MEIVIAPPKQDWQQLIGRAAQDVMALFPIVQPIMETVRQEGDRAVLDYEERFDHVALSSLLVSDKEMEEAETIVNKELKCAIRRAYQNIYAFHAAQRSAEIEVTTTAGVTCRQRSLPIEKVGLYVPGGTAPLFSTVLMLAVPATIAGCREVVLCTPPRHDGTIHPAILYAARLCGVRTIAKTGGAQAIAAMTTGTESIPRVYKLFGPGNAYVMAAKQLASLCGVAIDMPAGPSEVLVVADETCRPEFVAADLLSQAEHGPDSQAMLVTTSRSVLNRVTHALEQQLATLPRAEVVRKSLEKSRLIYFDSLNEAIDFANSYAPEHLILAVANCHAVANRITSAGSVFLGNYSCESAGDYASGTNHTLPTLGYARAYSGLSLDSFCHKMTLQELSPEGVRSIGPTVACMARAEQLTAHERAMLLRLNSLSASKE